MMETSKPKQPLFEDEDDVQPQATLKSTETVVPAPPAAGVDVPLGLSSRTDKIFEQDDSMIDDLFGQSAASSKSSVFTQEIKLNKQTPNDLWGDDTEIVDVAPRRSSSSVAASTVGPFVEPIVIRSKADPDPAIHPTSLHLRGSPDPAVLTGGSPDPAVLTGGSPDPVVLTGGSPAPAVLTGGAPAPTVDPTLTSSAAPSPLPVTMAPCPRLSVNSLALEQIAQLREEISRPPKVTVQTDPATGESNVSVKANKHADVFYTAMLFEMQVGLQQIREYRLRESEAVFKAEKSAFEGDKKHNRSDLLADSELRTSPTKLAAGAVPSMAAPAPTASGDSLSITVSEKPPASIKFSGNQYVEKTARDFPIQGGQDPFSEAIAKLLQMLMIFFANYPGIKQRMEIRALHKEMKKELDALKILDEKSPPAPGQPKRYDIALANLSPTAKDYVLATGSKKLQNACNAFYEANPKQPNGEIVMKVDPRGHTFESIQALTTKTQAYMTLSKPVANAIETQAKAMNSFAEERAGHFADLNSSLTLTKSKLNSIATDSMKTPGGPDVEMSSVRRITP